ncbi:hypothetical protein Lal_00016872 [Lupinus albus]|nr:hypothetical protein Lal_00016872 [Lupinus albus]
MWDTLQVTHEGTSEVKRARLNALTHEARNGIGALDYARRFRSDKEKHQLKATTSKSKEDKDDDESDSDLDDETMNLLVRKFSKFIKRKRGFKKFQKKEAKESTNKGKNNKDRFTCHEEFKSKKAYIVWDVPEEEKHQALLVRRSREAVSDGQI